MMMSTVCSNQEVEEERERGRGDVPVHPPPPPTLVAETPGWKFNPEEDELIDYFLYYKVAGIPIPSEHPILEKDLYGSEAPWDLFAGIDTTTTKKDLYFFTLIKDKFKSSSSNKKARVVEGKGTWRVQRPNNVHRNNNDKDVVVGLKRSFSFVADKSANRSKNESWVMHEYTMINYPHTQHYLLHGRQWAVCKLSRLLKKPSSSSYCYCYDQYQYSQPSSGSLSLPNKRSLDCCSSHDDIDPMPSSKKHKNAQMPLQKDITSSQSQHEIHQPPLSSCGNGDQLFPQSTFNSFNEPVFNQDPTPPLPPPPPGEDNNNLDMFCCSEFFNPIPGQQPIHHQQQVLEENMTPTASRTTTHDEQQLDIQFKEIDREVILAMLEEEDICHTHDDQQQQPKPGWDMFSYSQLLTCEDIDDHHLQLSEQNTTTTTPSSLSKDNTSKLQQQQQQDGLQWDLEFEDIDTDEILALIG